MRFIWTETYMGPLQGEDAFKSVRKTLADSQ